MQVLIPLTFTCSLLSVHNSYLLHVTMAGALCLHRLHSVCAFQINCLLHACMFCACLHVNIDCANLQGALPTICTF